MENSFEERRNLHEISEHNNILIASNSNRNGFDFKAMFVAVAAEWGKSPTTTAEEIKAQCNEKLISFVKSLARAQAFEDRKKEVLQ